MLANGKVLIAGGYNDFDGNLASAELYDPSTGTFAATGNMSRTRCYHAATLLRDGKVLMAGGDDDLDQALASRKFMTLLPGHSPQRAA